MGKKERIKYFKKCVKYWIKYFGLFTWDIVIDGGEDTTCLAWACWHEIGEGRRASIYYNKKWIKRERNKKELNKTAFHEVCEVFLSRVRDLMAKWNTKNSDEQIHYIIHFLENKLFKHKE